MAHYQLTHKAESEIEGIYEYSLLNFGLQVAKTYIAGLHDCFLMLPADGTVAKTNPRLKPYEAFRTKERTERLVGKKMLLPCFAEALEHRLDASDMIDVDSGCLMLPFHRCLPLLIMPSLTFPLTL